MSIADIIGILGFLISIFTLIINHFQRKTKFKIFVADYVNRGSVIQFLLCISNLSSEPLTIVSIKFNEITCELEPKKIRGNPEDWNSVTTPRFPVCIAAHSSCYVYLEFLGCEHISLNPGTVVNFQIYTTLRQVQKNITLDNTSHYLHKKR